MRKSTVRHLVVLSSFLTASLGGFAQIGKPPLCPPPPATPPAPYSGFFVNANEAPGASYARISSSNVNLSVPLNGHGNAYFAYESFGPFIPTSQPVPIQAVQPLPEPPASDNFSYNIFLESSSLSVLQSFSDGYAAYGLIVEPSSESVHCGYPPDAVRPGISGRLVDNNNQPLSNIIVTLQAFVNGAQHTTTFGDVYTDENGVFSFYYVRTSVADQGAFLPPGTYQLNINWFNQTGSGCWQAHVSNIPYNPDTVGPNAYANNFYDIGDLQPNLVTTPYCGQ